MRIRSIKPEFWRSSDISTLEIEDRLLFIGLWSYVDDNGVGIDKLSTVTADLFADDLERDPPETFARVSRGLARLSEAGRIVRYAVEGADFLAISGWSKHQRIDKPGKARFPAPTSSNAIIRESVARVRESVARVRESVAPGTGEQGNRGTGDQGTGEQVHAGGVLAISTPDLSTEFDRAYAAWPKKVNRKAALAKFERAARKRPVADLVADITRFGQAYAATTDRQFVPGLDAWINGERWTDELPQARHASASTSTHLDVLAQLREEDARESRRSGGTAAVRELGHLAEDEPRGLPGHGQRLA